MSAAPNSHPVRTLPICPVQRQVEGEEVAVWVAAPGLRVGPLRRRYELVDDKWHHVSNPLLGPVRQD
jgi:hypothetical protein